MKEIFKGYEREDCAELLDAARAVSRNDAEVVKAVETALGDPKSYLKRNTKRFEKRGIEFDNEKITDEFEPDDLLFLAMVDELEAFDYAFEFDYKCGLEDFLWGLTQIKNHELIKDVLKTKELDEDGDIEK